MNLSSVLKFLIWFRVSVIVEDDMNRYSELIVYQTGFPVVVMIGIECACLDSHLSIVSVVTKFFLKFGGPIYLGAILQCSAQPETST